MKYKTKQIIEQLNLIAATKGKVFAQQNGASNEAIDIAIALIKERSKGKWIKMSDADGIYYACSECGEELTRIEKFNPQFDSFPRLKSIDKTQFCPNCGADMRGE